MDTAIIAALIAIVPTTASVIVGYLQSRQSRREAAKNSIRTLIMHDQLNYELNGKLPTHQERIHDEYDRYHSSGGNGIITREVEEYDKWVESLNKKEK